MDKEWVEWSTDDGGFITVDEAALRRLVRRALKKTLKGETVAIASRQIQRGVEVEYDKEFYYHTVKHKAKFRLAAHDDDCKDAKGNWWNIPITSDDIKKALDEELGDLDDATEAIIEKLKRYVANEYWLHFPPSFYRKVLRGTGKLTFKTCGQVFHLPLDEFAEFLSEIDVSGVGQYGTTVGALFHRTTGKVELNEDYIVYGGASGLELDRLESLDQTYAAYHGGDYALARSYAEHLIDQIYDKIQEEERLFNDPDDCCGCWWCTDEDK